jgi:MoxR-like ATPase
MTLNVQDCINTIASIHGSALVAPQAIWCDRMLSTGRALAEVCGVSGRMAEELRPHEIRALYSMAMRSESDAKAFVVKKGWNKGGDATKQAPPPPPIGNGAGFDVAAVDALIAKAEKAAREACALYSETLPEAVKVLVNELAPRQLHIYTAPKSEPVKLEGVHRDFDKVLKLIQAKRKPFLLGPAGSGKTTLAKQIAEAFKLPFYCESKVSDEFTLLGYNDMTGEFVRTSFRECFEHGGVFLFDEIDASNPNAVVAINSALANGYVSFRDKMIFQHPDCIIIGAGNTLHGDTWEYSGRNKLDGATIDRFCIIKQAYDLDLEKRLAGQHTAWFNYVLACRDYCRENEITALVSPRATIDGAALLTAGFTPEETAELTILDKLTDTDKERLAYAVRLATYY